MPPRKIRKGEESSLPSAGNGRGGLRRSGRRTRSNRAFDETIQVQNPLGSTFGHCKECCCSVVTVSDDNVICNISGAGVTEAIRQLRALPRGLEGKRLVGQVGATDVYAYKSKSRRADEASDTASSTGGLRHVVDQPRAPGEGSKDNRQQGRQEREPGEHVQCQQPAQQQPAQQQPAQQQPTQQQHFGWYSSTPAQEASFSWEQQPFNADQQYPLPTEGLLGAEGGLTPAFPAGYTTPLHNFNDYFNTAGGYYSDSNLHPQGAAGVHTAGGQITYQQQQQYYYPPVTATSTIANADQGYVPNSSTSQGYFPSAGTNQGYIPSASADPGFFPSAENNGLGTADTGGGGTGHPVPQQVAEPHGLHALTEAIEQRENRQLACILDPVQLPAEEPDPGRVVNWVNNVTTTTPDDAQAGTAGGEGGDVDLAANQDADGDQRGDEQDSLFPTSALALGGDHQR